MKFTNIFSFPTHSSKKSSFKHFSAVLRNKYTKDNDLHAFHLLAELYLAPDCPLKDPVKTATLILIECADRDYVRSAKMLGDIYSENIFLKPDLIEARAWYVKAAKLGCFRSAVYASKIYGDAEVTHLISELLVKQTSLPYPHT